MRKMIFVASAAIAALSMPALAQGQGQGQGHGQGQEHGQGQGLGRDGGLGQDHAIPASPNANESARGPAQEDVRAGTDSRASERAQERTGASIDRTTDGDDDNVDDGDDDQATRRYGGDVCPPGLSGRDPACVPPGQANQTFTVGQTVPDDFRFLTDLDGVHEQFRGEVPAEFQTDAYQYFYTGDTIYVVTAADSTVAAVIDLDD
jgi:hypothetical protein